MVLGSAQSNRFVAALPAGTRSTLEGRMTSHGGTMGDILQADDARIDALWFPLSGIISSLRRLEGDGNVEVDATGSEGFLGFELVLGAPRTPDCWMIQSPGRFGRLDAHVFHELVLSDRVLREAAQRYAGAMLALRGQWVACNARHTIEQRLARWLLATRDRVGDEIQITQDIVAMMLGVRRASVVTALGRFVDEGLVNHGYARVRVVDDVRLEHLSCPCYGRAAALRREAYAG